METSTVTGSEKWSDKRSGKSSGRWRISEVPSGVASGWQVEW